MPSEHRSRQLAVAIVVDFLLDDGGTGETVRQLANLLCGVRVRLATQQAADGTDWAGNRGYPQIGVSFVERINKHVSLGGHLNGSERGGVNCAGVRS